VQAGAAPAAVHLRIGSDAMFGRRNPLPLSRRLIAALWPRGGFGRLGRYVGHRLGRLPGTPYRLAAGFACGAAVSFTPFIGLHFVGAALLALAMRGNLLASAIGTVVGNPWTFPFIWGWSYFFGQWLLGGSATFQLPENLTVEFIFDHVLDVLWPMTVGGLPTAVVVWFGFYWPVYRMVDQYQKARRRRIRRKVYRRLLERRRQAETAQAGPVQAAGMAGKTSPEATTR
jgi:uncharacterized protein (DUF2062 family)